MFLTDVELEALETAEISAEDIPASGMTGCTWG